MHKRTEPIEHILNPLRHQPGEPARTLLYKQTPHPTPAHGAERTESPQSRTSQNGKIGTGDSRRVMRCGVCGLNQFETRSGNCRRCGRILEGSWERLLPVVVRVQRELRVGVQETVRLRRALAFRKGISERKGRARRFGEYVRGRRGELGISRREAAERAGKPRRWWYRVEDGAVGFFESNVEAVARGLGEEEGVFVKRVMEIFG